MTNIKFYVCPQPSLQQRILLACKLTAKARARDWNVYIHTDSHETSEQVDEMLWTWNDLSFMPHQIAPGNSDVLIGHDYEPQENCHYLINISTNQPEFFSRFERFAEILDKDTEVLELGRTRYRFYRDRGYPLDYHTL